MTSAEVATILRQASFQANLLVRSTLFSFADREDISQDLAYDCLRRSAKFNSKRGDFSGFVRGVMHNQAAAFVVRKQRRAQREVLAADLPQGDVADDGTLCQDIFDRWPCSSPVDALNLSLDVRRVVDRLPDQLQTLALLLRYMPVRDVCRHTGKSRSRVYQMTRQLRLAFVRAGFSGSAARTARSLEAQ